MNESVWLGQIAEALISFIRETVTVKGEPVTAFVRKPEEEFVSLKYPCVSIQHLVSSQHQMRHDFGSGLIADRTQHKVDMYDPIIPFSHVYQIDFWAKYQSQLDEMTYNWLSKVKFDTNVKAKTVAGNEVSFLMLQEYGLRRLDFLEERERLFRAMMSYTIYTDIDTREITEIPTITETEVLYK